MQKARPPGPGGTSPASTVGHEVDEVYLVAALRALRDRRMAQPPAVQVVVVVGHHDHDKQTALAASGLTPASQWWTAPTGNAL